MPSMRCMQIEDESKQSRAKEHQRKAADWEESIGERTIGSGNIENRNEGRNGRGWRVFIGPSQCADQHPLWATPGWNHDGCLHISVA